jgi:hypothetical protein
MGVRQAVYAEEQAQEEVTFLEIHNIPLSILDTSSQRARPSKQKSTSTFLTNHTPLTLIVNNLTSQNGIHGPLRQNLFGGVIMQPHYEVVQRRHNIPCPHTEYNRN